MKVAIVEDNHEFREYWVEALNAKEGFTCIAAFSNAPEAVEGLPEVRADVVLMDISLPPDGSGIEVIQKVRSLCTQTQFMIFTVWSDDDKIFDSLQAGATGYLLKSAKEEDVFRAIEELHKGGSPMSPPIARRVLQSFQAKQVPPHPSKEIVKLAPREIQTLELLSEGLLYKEIAERMNITIGNLKQKIHTIYLKLEVANRTEALNKFKRR